MIYIKRAVLALTFLSASYHSFSQELERGDAYLKFKINTTVTNESADYFEPLYKQWINYLEDRQFMKGNHPFWNYDTYRLPDYSYYNLLADILKLDRTGKQVQCTLLGIIPVENSHYMIKSMFTTIDPKDLSVNLGYIVSVYAIKTEDGFQFINSTAYHKSVWKNQSIESINYIIHPEHKFSKDQADRMLEFNKLLAEEYKIDPITFDYVVTNNTTQLMQCMGYDFFNKSYLPVQTGGMADNNNRVIYAGNNSAYYPHELVHFYNYMKAGKHTHFWVDEGVATLFGGSTGYDLEWHLEKLRSYLESNPEFSWDTLDELAYDIPNGEFTTDFRYVIGGLLMQQVYEKEGMNGIIDAIQIERTDEAFFALLKEKLNVDRADFVDYIKESAAALTPLSDEEMKCYKY